MPLALLLMAACARVQPVAEVVYLKPATHFVSLGQSARLALSSPISVAQVDRVQSAFVMTGTGRSNLEEMPESVELQPGSAVCGVEFAPRTLSASESAEWLRTAGLESAAPRRMTLNRSASTVIVYGAGGESMGAARSGMITELRPMRDPAQVEGGDLGFRFYSLDQEAAKGARFVAVNTTTGRKIESTTSRAGMGFITAIDNGIWNVMAAIVEDGRGGTTLSIATTTFEIRGVAR